MSTFDRSQFARVEVAPTVDTGSQVAVPLPDGPGLYVLHRVFQEKTAGSTTTNHQCKLFEQSTVASRYLFFYADGTTPSANDLFWPGFGTATEPTIRPAFESVDGNAYWQPNPNTTGDTWRLVLVVERVR